MQYQQLIKKRIIVFAPRDNNTFKFISNLKKYFSVKYNVSDIIRIYVEVRFKGQVRKILVLKCNDTSELMNFWPNWKRLKREQWWYKWKI